MCGKPFPYIIEQKGSLDRWYVEEGGRIFYTDTFNFEDQYISNIISSNAWTCETMNPRFAPLFVLVPDFYLELDGGVFHAHTYYKNTPAMLWRPMNVKVMEHLIKEKTWAQIPPLIFPKKQDLIPAKKRPELIDIFPTL